MMKYDEQEIRKTFSILCNKFTEVRLLKNNLTVSGYFSDAECLLRNMKKYANEQEMNFYIVLNRIDDACYSRQQKDCFVERPKTTTSDKDITVREWLMLDFDCERPAGVSSTNEELALSKAKAGEVYKYLANAGFEKPVIALSGNGVHLLYKIELENNEPNLQLVKDCLIALSYLFSDDKVKIDTAVFNASRITKLYGTVASKGASTEDRPHRMSKILSVPEELKKTDISILVSLAKTFPEPPKPSPNTYRSQEQFDIDAWIRKYGLSVAKESASGGTRKIVLSECPFNPEHKSPDSAMFVMNNGAIGFKCLHSSCSRYDWKDVRLKFEPTAYDAKERIVPQVNSVKKNEDPVPEEPNFYTAMTVKPVNRAGITSIKTGLKDLDRRIIGLNKGEVSCFSGINGSGKSSFLSQIVLETIQAGYKVTVFSGELPEANVLGWLQLQAAGKQYTMPTQYEDYFYVEDETKNYINQWLNDKIFIYNNRKGNNINQIMDRVLSCIKQNKVDLIILDNLMAMDLTQIVGDKYEKQSSFIKQIKAFARDNNVHIVIVAHPRKTTNFLRKDDISGTADITNVVDNVFIIHRVNNDFIRLSGMTFGWKEGHELYKCSNVIEVCKNRDLGIQDLFVPMHYEVESKRFLNTKFEVKHYGWEDLMDCKLPFDV